MAKNTFLDWDTTAANNTDVGGIGILGTNNVSNFDNALRTIMAQLKAGVDGEVVFASKSTNYTAVVNDNNAVHRFTANATLSLTAAATLGSGWHYTVFANGGTVTVDPNGSETINGATTLTVADGSVAAIFCDGTGFRAYNLPTLSGANTWTGVNTFNAGALVPIVLTGASPRINFTDTDTNVDHAISANSTVGGFFIFADINGEGSDPNFSVSVGAGSNNFIVKPASVTIAQPTTISVNTASNLLTVSGNQGGGGDWWGARLITLSNFAPGIFWNDNTSSAQKALTLVDSNQFLFYGTPNTDGTSLTQRASLNLSNGNWTIGGALSVGDAATTRTNLAVGSVRLSRAVVSSAVSAVDIALPSGYDSYELRINNLIVNTDAVQLFCRFSYDGGSTYRSGASDYAQSAAYAGASNTWLAFNEAVAGVIAIMDSVTNTDVGNNGYYDIYPGSASRRTNIVGNNAIHASGIGMSTQIHSGRAAANGLATHIRIFAGSSATISTGIFTLIGYN